MQVSISPLDSIRGKKGFSTYLKTLKMGSQQTFGCETFEAVMTFDCINCDFVAASALDDATKKIIRRYTTDAGLKICRSKDGRILLGFNRTRCNMALHVRKMLATLLKHFVQQLLWMSSWQCINLKPLGSTSKGLIPR